MTEPERTADRLALRALVEQYAGAADQRDPGRFAGAFTGDGFLQTSRGRVIRGAELAGLATDLHRYRATMHLVGNHHVTFDGDDAAHGEVYCQASHVRAVDGADWVWVMAIVYHDVYVRLSEGWRIAERRLDVLWTEDRPLRAPGAP